MRAGWEKSETALSFFENPGYSNHTAFKPGSSIVESLADEERLEKETCTGFAASLR